MADQPQQSDKAVSSVPAQPEEDVKCANHPDRKGAPVDFGGVTLNLCEECTPKDRKTA